MRGGKLTVVIQYIYLAYYIIQSQVPYKHNTYSTFYFISVIRTIIGVEILRFLTTSQIVS